MNGTGRFGRLLTIALAAIAAVLAGVPAASGHQPAMPGERVPDTVADALGGAVSVTRDGLYEVRTSSGFRFRTHGPDVASGSADPLTDEGGDLNVGDPERAPVCVGDPSTGYYQKILYAHPSGANGIETERANIQGIVRRMNWLLNAESLASGGPHADYIVRCTGDGEIKVSAFAVPPSPDVEEVITAARNAGFANERADYTILLDGPTSIGSGVCGVANYFADDRLIADNRSNNPPKESAGYAVSVEGCWYGNAPMHENGHNQGAVPFGAPTGVFGHAPEGNDVMNSGAGGPPCALPGDWWRFDCGWDTYFDSAPEPGEWLATHWNLGSPLNRFIEFTPVPTRLLARPMVIDDQPAPVMAVPLGRLSADLTNLATDGPLAGKEIVFSSGSSELCRAQTDDSGTATCTLELDGALRAILGIRYTAEFAGDAMSEPSSATGKLARLPNGSELF